MKRLTANRYYVARSRSETGKHQLEVCQRRFVEILGMKNRNEVQRLCRELLTLERVYLRRPMDNENLLIKHYDEEEAKGDWDFPISDLVKP